jgi:hypothetical protein
LYSNAGALALAASRAVPGAAVRVGGETVTGCLTASGFELLEEGL